MKGISVVLYGSELGKMARESDDKGGELIYEFLEKLSHAMRNKIFSWDFFD